MKGFGCVLTWLLQGFIVLSSGQQAVSDFKSASELQTAAIGICVRDMEKNKVVAAYNSRQGFVPASLVKLLTTATLWELYDPDEVLETRVTYTGTVDDEGVLKGDLYVRGVGDPSLGSEYSLQPKDGFEKDCIQALKKAGIRRISGRVIADASLFDREGVSPKWLWEDLGNYFAAGAYGINFSDNMYRLTLRSGKPGSRPEIVGISPVIKGLRFENYLTAKSNYKDSAYIYGMPFSNERAVCGSIPAGRKAFVVKGDMPDPVSFLAEHLTGALEKAGIPVEAGAGTDFKGEKNGEERVLFSFRSDPLQRMVRVTNERSNNLYAECLLRLIALKKYRIGSASGGIEVMRHFWKEKGVRMDGLFLYDGCGLSPINRVSPDLLCEILTLAACHPEKGSAFCRTLPLAGREGTVSSFLKRTPLEGKIRLKSGSMGQVQCYAGYYTGKNKYAVAIMINDFSLSRNRLKERLQTLLVSLFQEIDEL